LQHIPPPADQNNARTRLYKTFRNAEAKPAASAGDEGDFAFERKCFYHDGGHSLLKNADFKGENPDWRILHVKHMIVHSATSGYAV
jgi:hypothetical protein